MTKDWKKLVENYGGEDAAIKIYNDFPEVKEIIDLLQPNMRSIRFYHGTTSYSFIHMGNINQRIWLVFGTENTHYKPGFYPKQDIFKLFYNLPIISHLKLGSYNRLLTKSGIWIQL